MSLRTEAATLSKNFGAAVNTLRQKKSSKQKTRGQICCLAQSCRTVGLFLPFAQVNTSADVIFVFQEALRYFNQTTKQKEMLEFALNYLQTDEEVGFLLLLQSRDACCLGSRSCEHINYA